MLSLLLLTLATIDDPPRPRPKVKPAAMLFEVRGKVEIRPAGGPAKAAEVGDLLYSDEVLAVPDDGKASVSILGVGAVEAIRPGAEAKVGPKGCTPPESVLARKEGPPSVAEAMKGLKPDPGDPRKAGLTTRSPADGSAGIIPIYGTTVISDRPAFAWPATEKATTYRFHLLSAGRIEMWKIELKEPKLDFPADKPALGEKFYFWEVTDQDYRQVASGKLSVANQSTRAQLEELKSLASGDAADRYSAALAYRRLAAFAEAIGVLESLARDEPGVEVYRRDLAELRKLAGR